jgi:histidine triad (HIT) family protein
LQEDKAADAMKTAKKAAALLKDKLGADGLNVVQNNGAAAGQTVFHFHMHLIPRYKGDKSGFGWKSGALSDADKEEILGKLNKL